MIIITIIVLIVMILKSLGNVVCDNLREQEMCGESENKQFNGKEN